MDTVGSYRLLRQIGEGGMGVVHLALAPDGSRVAVKILRPQVIGGREARQRLEREVAAMRRVRSPRVAECVDADPWGDPPFVVTRYVPGLSLTEYVAEYGPLDAGRLHRFALGTAEALTGVHAAGVLHRDIKPSNVLLHRDQPVLIDFGAARRYGGGPPRTRVRTPPKAEQAGAFAAWPSQVILSPPPVTE